MTDIILKIQKALSSRYGVNLDKKSIKLVLMLLMLTLIFVLLLIASNPFAENTTSDFGQDPVIEVGE